MTCTIHSYDLTGLCFTCGHINESIRAHQQAADAWHREYAKANPPTLPPEIEAALTDHEAFVLELANDPQCTAENAKHGRPPLLAAITSALAAAREAGRREVLEGAAGVETAMQALESIAYSQGASRGASRIGGPPDGRAADRHGARDKLRAAIAADKARAVEAASDAAFDRGRAATIKYADGLVMRPVLSREDAERLVNVLIGSVVGAALEHTSPSINAMAIDARTALLAALTGAGGGS